MFFVSNVFRDQKGSQGKYYPFLYELQCIHKSADEATSPPQETVITPRVYSRLQRRRGRHTGQSLALPTRSRLV